MSTHVDLPGFDLRLLPSFVAVAEELHFGRAAERLFVAQPALSRQVSRLESQLGVQLFHRSSRDVELSVEGLQFLGAAREILVRAARAEAAARDLSGQLTVHLGDGLDPLVQRLVHSFEAANPVVRMRILDGAQSEASTAVKEGSADVGFDTLEGVPDGLGFLSVDRPPLGTCVLPGHWLARLRTVSWTDLEDEAVVTAPPGVGEGYNVVVRSTLRRYGVRHTEVEAGHSKASFLGAFIAHGSRVLLCPRYVLDDWPEPMVWTALTPTVTLDIGVVWDQLRTTETVQRFLDWAKRPVIVDQAVWATEDDPEDDPADDPADA